MPGASTWNGLSALSSEPFSSLSENISERLELFSAEGAGTGMYESSPVDILLFFWAGGSIGNGKQSPLARSLVKLESVRVCPGTCVY